MAVRVVAFPVIYILRLTIGTLTMIWTLVCSLCRWLRNLVPITFILTWMHLRDTPAENQPSIPERSYGRGSLPTHRPTVARAADRSHRSHEYTKHVESSPRETRGSKWGVGKHWRKARTPAKVGLAGDAAPLLSGPSRRSSDASKRPYSPPESIKPPPVLADSDSLRRPIYFYHQHDPYFE